MRNQLTNKATALLLAGWMLLSVTTPAWAAAGEVTISSTGDLAAFAQDCALDTWSQGKTVRLTADLDLTGVDFTPIPTFGGTFLGGGHAIKGLRLTASGSQQGLFRYLQPSGTISDLRVEGTVRPSGSRANVGGIVGSNSGIIQNCTFHGTVKGDANVGGITGENGKTGQINGCSVSGTVQGQMRTGGIAGKNLGILLKCGNAASVNTSEEPTAPDVDPADALNQLADGEAAESVLDGHTDTGGVVGYSSGVVQSCTNTGSVGYQHVGYNVGGIAGRQTGYLSGCVNSGTVLGRKDVGGIAGQAEPYIALNPGSDILDRLRRELDTLDSLISQALDDADTAGDDLSARLSSMRQITDSARDSSKRLLDGASDFIDSNMESLNSISVTVVNALDNMAPAVDEFENAAHWLDRMTGGLEDGLEDLELSPESEAVLRAAVQKLQTASDRVINSSIELKTALEALVDALVKNGDNAVETALGQVRSAMEDLGDAYREAGDAFGEMEEPLAPLLLDGELPEEIQNILNQIAEALEHAGISLPDSSEDWAEVREALKQTVGALGGGLTAARDLGKAAGTLLNALGDMLLDNDLNGAVNSFQSAADHAGSMSRALERAFGTLADVVRELSEDGPVEFASLGEETRTAGEDLYAALGSLSSEMEELNTSMQGNSDVLTADVRAISGQFNTVFDVLLDALADLRNNESPEVDDYIQDTSDENIAATRLGKVADCRSTGAVEGDRNVGGILGSMAIEYDLDPEDDIDRFSFNSTYETKAVLENCVNHGSVTGKKDCVGGLVGRMDLGTVIDGQNYGAVESSGGNYVGGIAGRSDGSIRRCYAKCTLAGSDYVGGIAGWTDHLTDSCAIATFERSVECAGAVAGDADLENGVIRNNCFVDTGTAAIDGVSYTGKAAPVAFEELRQRESVPSEFVSFNLTLLADGETVAKIPFLYGNDLSLMELPEVPEREDAYGVWPEFSTSGLDSDITLEAVYTPWVTLVASPEQSGKLPLVLAEGRFTQDAVLHVTDSDAVPPEEGARSVWEVTLTGTDLADSDIIPLRLLNEGRGKAAVRQLIDGEWRPVDADRNGQYLLLNMTGTVGTFCVCGAQNGQLTAVYFLLLAALFLLLVIFAMLKRRPRKKAAKAVKEKSTK